MTSPAAWQWAREHAHAAARALPPRHVGLREAVGCVLAEDLLADCDLPPRDTSAMDGWAVCGSPPWRVVGQALAGRGPDHPAVLAPSQAVVVATGAALPGGVTGIVRTERALLEGDLVRPGDGMPAEADLRDVRRRGHEARAGDLLVERGRVVRATTVGLAAAAGHDGLTVHPLPRVDVLVLGDELLDEGPPRGGAVRDALGVQLPGWVVALGGLPALTLRVPDDKGSTAAALGATTGDVVVTTGGSAAGAADHLREVLADLGADLVVDTVDVRPGHPMLLARLRDGRLLIGLPGNPLAALAGVVTLLTPVLAGLRGAPLPAPGSATSAEPIEVYARDRRLRGHLLIPVARSADGCVRSTGYASSAMLRGAAAADGFALVGPDGVAAGAPVDVIWFPWTPPNT